jgi:hypothetical protein
MEVSYVQGLRSKTITYTKVITFINTILWGVKSSQVPMFLTSCENLSIDKVLTFLIWTIQVDH